MLTLETTCESSFCDFGEMFCFPASNSLVIKLVNLQKPGTGLTASAHIKVNYHKMEIWVVYVLKYNKK